MIKYKHSKLFRRILPERKLPRSLLWTIGMLISVIGLMIYLNNIATG